MYRGLLQEDVDLRYSNASQARPLVLVLGKDVTQRPGESEFVGESLLQEGGREDRMHNTMVLHWTHITLIRHH